MANEQSDKPNAFHVGSMKFEAGQVYVDDAGNKYVVSSAVSSTAFVPEGERKSLAGQAIEMAISALRDIQRRAPGTRTFFDYEAFIERELVPAMAMADKDRQGCIGLMGLLAKEKLKVEELSKPVSAIGRAPKWLVQAGGERYDTWLCATREDVRKAFCEALFGDVESATAAEIDGYMEEFDRSGAEQESKHPSQTWRFEDGWLGFITLSPAHDDISNASQP